MKTTTPQKIHGKITIRELTLFLIVASIGFFYIGYIWVTTKHERSLHALQIARSVEASLPFENIQKLTANPADTALQAYKNIKETLHGVIQVNPQARFAYLYLVHNGKLYFMVDSEPEGSPDISPPGQEFTEADFIDFQPFRTGKAQITKPVTDRWGTWVSIEVPVINNTTGEIVAAFGMDYDASSWSKTLFFAVLESSALVILALILILAIRISLAKNDFLRQEIREREIAEKELRKLSQAIEQNPVTVVITDAKGNIEYVNPKFTEVTGFSAHEATGQNPNILKSGQMDNQIYTDLWKTIISGKIWQGEMVNKRKSGELYWVNKSISPIIDQEGRITNFVAIGEEITEKKLKEEELIKAKEKAEEGDRLKSAFLANISHEIRTPMNGILGFADLLKTPALPPENQQEFISMIEQNGQRMLSTINNLIDISKIEAGEKSLKITAIDINHLMEELFRLYKPLADHKNLLLSYSVGSLNSESMVNTDRLKLKKILSNLINNGIKFTNRGQVEFGYTVQGSKLVFFVKDTGIGIQKAQEAVIFEQFKQGSMGFSRSHEGVGLGLAISKAYVELLGGSIRVESEPGKGSTFRIDLPVHYSAN